MARRFIPAVWQAAGASILRDRVSSVPPSTPDVIVIGAGLIGLGIAWQALRGGASVLVLERDRRGGSSGTSSQAAGMLAPASEADPGELPLLELSVASARQYPGFIEALRSDSPLPSGYLGCGTLRVARDRGEAQELERALALRERLGVPGRRLRGSEARALEPSLAPTLRLGAEFPQDHAVDPRALSAALADAVRRRGGMIREGARITRIVGAAGRAQGVELEDGEQLRGGQVVVAAGVWSGEIEGVSDELPLRPVKGQILRLRDPAGPGLLTRVLRLERAYVVPRGDGRYVLGATMEERGFDQTVTAGAVWELLREAGEVLPGSGEWIIDELTAGLRPGTPDNAPIIGHGRLKGLLWAVGHYRNGVLLTPVTAQLVASLLAGEAPAHDLASFSPTRFALR